MQEPFPVTEASPASQPTPKRSEPRQRCLLRGKVIFAQGRYQVDCTVRDLTLRGARIRLAGQVQIPDTFYLLLTGENITLPAEVRWRRELEFGLRFTGPAVAR